MQPCPHCSTQFSPIRVNQIYCSPGCQHKAEKKRARKRAQQNAIDKRIRETGLLPNEKLCETCGAKFEAKFNGEKYCSDECRRTGSEKRAIANYERKKEEARLLGPKLKRCDCLQCGKQFFSERSTKLCSEACRRGRQRDRYRHRTHGVGDGSYESMLRAQDAKCLICKEIKRLVVDHCHKNGHVRGLLCSQCNSGLGFFQDDVENLARAVLYLKERGTPTDPANPFPPKPTPEKIA